jgi:hypothetical protein
MTTGSGAAAKSPYAGIVVGRLWRGEQYAPGAEYYKLWKDDAAWHLEGTVARVEDDHPLQAHYRIECNAKWEAKEVDIDLEVAGESKALQISVDDQRRWWSSGRDWWASVRELEAVRGCFDVGLGITPSTSTLAIGRLGMPAGQAQDVRIAWIRFPELEVEPVAQRYTRLDEHTYKHEINNGRITAELYVDGSGMVADYQHLPRRPAFLSSEGRRPMVRTMSGVSRSAATQPARIILWRRLDLPGAEYCKLWREDDKWHLQGTVVLKLDDRPLQAHYRIECNAKWETERVEVDLEVAGESHALRLTADDERRWWSDGEELEAVRGCFDIDLGITPSTNTLPIRRLKMAVGQAEEVRAAWVKFPEMEVRLLPQTYTHLDEHTYRYESNNGRFTADLTVDASGIVTYYPGGWECSIIEEGRKTKDEGRRTKGAG